VFFKQNFDLDKYLYHIYFKLNELTSLTDEKIAYLGNKKHQLFNKIKGSPVERKQEKWANEKAEPEFLNI
jgi:hypothetical protein